MRMMDGMNERGSAKERREFDDVRALDDDGEDENEEDDEDGFKGLVTRRVSE
jgi:hypothetical protein